jgi:hypothetical protein
MASLTYEATAMSTTPDFSSFTDFQKRAFAPFLELNEFAVRTFERVARQAYEATGEAVELAIAQAHATVGATDVQQLATKQTQLVTDFVKRQSERSADFFKTAAETQAEMGKWAQATTKAANDELTQAARKTA